MSSQLAEPPATGNAAVDDALLKVANLAEVPLEEHPAILGAAQVALQDLLNSRPTQPNTASPDG